MNKLWAAVLTGLLGCSSVSWAADPVAPGSLPPLPTPPALPSIDLPASPYAPTPAVSGDDTTPVKKKTDDPKKTTDAKPLPSDPKTPAAPQDAKPADGKTPPALPGCGACAPSCTPTCAKPCGPCTVTVLSVKECGTCDACTPPPTSKACPPPCVPAPKPCPTPCVAAKPCAPCTKCRPCRSGKLLDWLTYRPLHLTGLCEIAADYHQPAIYTFFLDEPCRTNWKPSLSCDKPRGCGTCGGCTAPPPAAPLPPTAGTAPAGQAHPNMFGD